LSREAPNPKARLLLPDGDLPLDHPHWRFLSDLYAALLSRVGASALAGLMQALQAGSVRCIVQPDAKTEMRSWVTPAFWSVHEVCTGSDGMYVTHRHRTERLNGDQLQQEYRDQLRVKPARKIEEIDAHLEAYSKEHFGKTAHTDTLRDKVRRPVDLEK
jgi:hypothetical protein